MRVSKYSGEEFERTVRSSRSLSEVIRRLGLKPTGGNHRFIASRVRLEGIDTSHFTRRSSSRIADLTREQLSEAAASATSVAQVLVQFGLPSEGRPHRELTQRLEALTIDTSHFRGCGWASGETKQSSPIVARISQKRTRPDAEVFVVLSRETNGRRLVRRLRAQGWPYVCATCGINEWLGRPIVLHLDHINGVADDNRLQNLRLLCPNCHSQTDTYCGRNRGVTSTAR